MCRKLYINRRKKGDRVGVTLNRVKLSLEFLVVVVVCFFVVGGGGGFWFGLVWFCFVVVVVFLGG